ncbi:hypothetical protein DHEL01_v202735 [Diaporthe helianthi]|uniref:Uncharacterized protein n=1 Tax=Diaporthe helianthi TaxID=158607 RepID=A0A2P5I8M6_DIAHE|nr:hypothetical protein DHEL01_v202735 [Diaporthe helianthi]
MATSHPILLPVDFSHLGILRSSFKNFFTDVFDVLVQFGTVDSQNSNPANNASEQSSEIQAAFDPEFDLLSTI